MPSSPEVSGASANPSVPVQPTGSLTDVSIVGTGSYLPARIMTNAELERSVETSDEWITSRTGIRERRIAGDDEQTSDFGAGAAKAAMEQAGVSAMEIDLILLATASPEMFFPATACLVQKKLGARRATCMDISAACSGFLYAIEMARHMIAAGVIKVALIVGAEKLSAMVDWTDRNTCVLFGDGAGAAVLARRPAGRVGRGILTTYMGSDGDYEHILGVPGGGSRCPVTKDNVGSVPNTIKMNGKETFKQAVSAMTNACMEALERTGLSINDIACIIPHQANIRIIEAISDRLKVPMDRFMINLALYGNTGAAAVAIALDEANRTGRIAPGDKILLVVFGSGLTWASCIMEW